MSLCNSRLLPTVDDQIGRARALDARDVVVSEPG
jgi:hypothetical protein